MEKGEWKSTLEEMGTCTESPSSLPDSKFDRDAEWMASCSSLIEKGETVSAKSVAVTTQE